MHIYAALEWLAVHIVKDTCMCAFVWVHRWHDTHVLPHTCMCAFVWVHRWHDTHVLPHTALNYSLGCADDGAAVGAGDPGGGGREGSCGGAMRRMLMAFEPAVLRFASGGVWGCAVCVCVCVCEEMQNPGHSF